MASELQPPAGFQEELAAQAEQGGLISSRDWSQGSDKWAHAWSAICQVGVFVCEGVSVCVCMQIVACVHVSCPHALCGSQSISQSLRLELSTLGRGLP